MVNKKTNKQRRKMNTPFLFQSERCKSKKCKTRKMYRQNNKKVKAGATEKNIDDIKKELMNLDVYITSATNTDKRKIEFDVKTFHEFYDYLNEVDIYLKKIANEELLAFTDPKKFELWKKNHTPKKESYTFGYKTKSTGEDKNDTNE